MICFDFRITYGFYISGYLFQRSTSQRIAFSIMILFILRIVINGNSLKKKKKTLSLIQAFNASMTPAMNLLHILVQDCPPLVSVTDALDAIVRSWRRRGVRWAARDGIRIDIEK